MFDPELWPNKGPFRDFMREKFPNDEGTIVYEESILNLVPEFWGFGRKTVKEFDFFYPGTGPNGTECIDVTNNPQDYVDKQHVVMEVYEWNGWTMALGTFSDYGGTVQACFTNNLPHLVKVMTGMRDACNDFLKGRE